MVRIVIADDHLLFRKTIAQYIVKWTGFAITGEANNGYELLQCIHQLKEEPAIAIIDVNMPVIDGIQVTKILSDHFPNIKVLGVSLDSDSLFLGDMLDAGAKGFISKRNLDQHLKPALEILSKGGSYVEEEFENELLLSAQRKQNNPLPRNIPEISKKEHLFLQLNASDLEYKMIAKAMNVSDKSIHNYHDRIKDKTGISSRLGQTLFALKNGIAKMMRKDSFPK